MNNPSEEYLFTVNPNGKYLDSYKEDLFHSTISKASFVCKRARPNIQPTVTFLCTIFKGPNKDNYNKLLTMINYFQDTRGDNLEFKINNTTM